MRGNLLRSVFGLRTVVGGLHQPPAAMRTSGLLTARSLIFRSSSTVADRRQLKLINESDPVNNITQNIADHVGRQLHHQPNHPLEIIKTKIANHFMDRYRDSDGNPEFKLFDDLYPVVTTKMCFDDVLVPPGHISRQASDTYYVDSGHVLRAHTSAHQVELIRAGNRSFLVAGDVYRRDTVDATHYPAFHQMEGVRIYPAEDLERNTTEFAEAELKRDLEGMVRTLFGDVEMKWVDAYFPFTEPSFELEIFFDGDWLEVLGCGVIHQEVMAKCGLEDQKGYAFGLGLERLAMVLFDIPDIRLFWSEDERFRSQFVDGEVTKFVPYSKYPACTKDISFWLPEGYSENDFHSVVRSVGGDLVEQVELIDNFTNTKTGLTSHCYRIVYRSMDRNLTNEEIDKLQDEVRAQVATVLNAEVR